MTPRSAHVGNRRVAGRTQRIQRCRPRAAARRVARAVGDRLLIGSLKLLFGYFVAAAVEIDDFDVSAHLIPRMSGIPLRLLNLEGLLLSKQGQRPKDQMDAALLRQALAVLKPQDK
jgi:hypothetical protein